MFCNKTENKNISKTHHPYFPSYRPTPTPLIITIRLGGIDRCPVIIHPRLHTDEVGDEGGNVALENGRVTSDDEFVVDLRLVVLGHHWVRKAPGDY